MYKNIIGALFVLGALFLSKPSFADDKTRMESPFQAKEYNTVSNQYGDRLTSIIFEDNKKSKDVVWVTADFIRKSEFVREYGGADMLRFKEKHLDAHIEMFEKFLKWEEVARKDGDVFTKQMGITNKNIYTFHSGNSSSHYLTAQFCMLVCYSEFYFDRNEAEKVLSFLKKWKSGNLKVTSTEEINDKYK